MGTMTWGGQNDYDESVAMLECALGSGVNFFDAAEMYPIPVSEDTCSETERVIGRWLAANPDRRSEMIIATKITGRGVPHIRGGAKPDRDAVIQSVQDALARLQTDYVDLFQIHWPSRPVPHFAKHWPGTINPARTDPAQQSQMMRGLLEGLDHCVRAGMIRYCGLSNETPWGVAEYLRLAAEYQLPRVVSVQNEFNLLHTKDWAYMIESCAMNNVAYLPWSPLAGGALSGKYLGGVRPPGSRWTFAQRQVLFRDTAGTEQAVSAYANIAADHGITTAQLALAWVNQVSGVCSSIIGATSVAQLMENLEAFEIKLSDDCLDQLKGAMQSHPVPF